MMVKYKVKGWRTWRLQKVNASSPNNAIESVVEQLADLGLTMEQGSVVNT